MSDKKTQRQRRKSGVEEFSAFAYRPKLVAWLIWEGLLSPDVDDLPPKDRKAAIRKALENHLWRCYSHLADPSPTPRRIVVSWPGYAEGSLSRDFAALRDKPDPEASWPNPLVGTLEREGEIFWRDPALPFLISRRKEALRRAVPIPVTDAPDAERTSYCGERSTFDVATENPWYRGDEYDDPKVDADYDPEADAEEESADMLDEAVASLFDDEGYEAE
jgi:hypothetical protein